ncbi:hypothetical protein BH10ACI1_BH10ACI1_27920 [soil metagenome]
MVNADLRSRKRRLYHALQDTLDTRQDLDRALRNHYRNNPAKLAEWLTASHIERKKKKDEQPPTPET